MLDFVAARYGVLPSELVKRGDTMDIIIADAAQRYMNEKQEEARAKAEGRVVLKTPNLSQEQMYDMLNKVKGND
jgi:hypothetical protein